MWRIIDSLDLVITFWKNFRAFSLPCRVGNDHHYESHPVSSIIMKIREASERQTKGKTAKGFLSLSTPTVNRRVSVVGSQLRNFQCWTWNRKLWRATNKYFDDTWWKKKVLSRCDQILNLLIWRCANDMRTKID
jgi:hypothetical protein